MTGDDTAREHGIEALVAQRLEWYAMPGGRQHVPNPRRPVALDGVAPARTGTVVGAVGYGAGLGPAMAWDDYLDAVAYADSGLASVLTLEASRGGEERVRARLRELAPDSSQQGRALLEAELHRLCAEAWTLVGQERAEARLLDELDDVRDPR